MSARFGPVTGDAARAWRQMRRRWRAAQPALIGLGQVSWPFVLATALMLALAAQCFALMSAGRAYVQAESQWSKAQKNAVLALHRYIDTCDPQHAAAYLRHLTVPWGDRAARHALERDPPDVPAAYAGFRLGGVAEDDIAGMVFIFRWLRWVGPVQAAVDEWRQADLLLDQLDQVAEALQRAVQRDCADIARQASHSAQLHRLNAALNARQVAFSAHLGEANHLLSQVALGALLAFALGLGLVGLGLSYRAVRTKVRAMAEAEAANRTQRDFLANMNHELRTPMNGVLGLLGALEQQGPLNPDQRESAELMRSAGQGLLGVLDDLLDVARLDGPGLTLDERPTDTVQVVEQACAVLDPLALDAGVDVTLHIDDAVPVLVQADPQRLRQIVQHLVGNAVKFSAPPPDTPRETRRRGRVHVRWTASHDAAHASLLCLSVSDNGIGIADAALKRLFRPFVQADGSRTRRHGGAGLGLAITQGLVDAMRGRIEVQSSPGQGSQFRVWLPLRDLSPRVSDPSAASTRTALPAAAATGRCLLVAAADGAATDLCAALEGVGWRTERFDTLEQLLARLPSGAGEPGGPALCIIDHPDSAWLSPEQTERCQQALGPALATLTGTSPDGRPATATGAPVRVLHLCRGRRRRLRAHPFLPGHALDINVLTRSRWQQVVEQVLQAPLPSPLTPPAASPQPAPGPAHVPVPVPVPVPTKAPEPAAPATVASAAQTSSPAPRSERILVAEDNPANQKVIAFQLRKLGFAAELAADGEQALTAWRNGRHDLLLTDLHMPVMDGFELAQALRQEAAQRPGGGALPIIALTANGQSGEAERCRAQGMNDFLTKPTQLPVLLATIDRWLQATAPSADSPSPSPTSPREPAEAP